MLAVSSLTSVENERQFSMEDEFEEFTSGNLLDSIDFDDIFVGIEVLPDLEMYQDFLATEDENNSGSNHPAPESVSVSGSVSGSEVGFGSSSLIQGEEIMSKRDASGKSRKSSSHSKKPPGKKKAKVKNILILTGP